jgi:hypothetical protein
LATPHAKAAGGPCEPGQDLVTVIKPAVTRGTTLSAPATSQPGMSVSRGISKSSLTVALYRSFDRPGWDDGPWAFPWASHPTDQEPATHATVGTRSNTDPELCPRHTSNPPSRAHSQRATSCRNNAHRPHRGISNARPLQPLPEPITDPAAITHLAIRRRDRLGGIIHEYQRAA